MPPEQARLIASAAYTLARAANADLDISDEETAAIERELQAHEALDEATAVLVTEMAKLQAKTVGGTEDYVVTREFKALADMDQRLVVLRACFAVMAANGTISAEETAVDQRDRRGARHRRRDAQRDPRRIPRAAVVGPGDPAGHRGRLTPAPREADMNIVLVHGSYGGAWLGPRATPSGATRRPSHRGRPADQRPGGWRERLRQDDHRCDRLGRTTRPGLPTPRAGWWLRWSRTGRRSGA